MKAQATIEFLFIFLVMLIAVNTVILPAMEHSRRSLAEIYRVGMAKLAAQQIANAVAEVSSASGEARETLWVFLDQNIKLFCDTPDRNAIIFVVPVEVESFSAMEDNVTIADCNGEVCKVIIPLPLPDDRNVILDCSNFKVCDTATYPGCDYIDGSFVSKVRVIVLKQYADLGMGEKAYVRLWAQEPQKH